MGGGHEGTCWGDRNVLYLHWVLFPQVCIHLSKLSMKTVTIRAFHCMQISQ